MKKVLDFDYFDVFVLISGLTLSIFFIICSYFSFRQLDEKECVSFYKENNYILDTCEKYSSKFEDLKK